MAFPVQTLSQLRPILVGFRKSAGFTQAQLAARLGVTQQSYAQLEANPSAVSIERLFKVLNVLGVRLMLEPGTPDDAPAPDAADPDPARAPATCRPMQKNVARTWYARRMSSSASSPSPPGKSSKVRYRTPGGAGSRPARRSRTTRVRSAVRAIPCAA